MARLSSAVFLAAFLGTSCAQEVVWGSVVYVFHGETTPISGPNPSLTPVGAQQMYTLGSQFRGRYLYNNNNNNNTASGNTVTSYVGIQGISDSAVDNFQLDIMSTNDEYVSTSAMAFLQGLYPPSVQTYASDAGGIGAADLANGSVVDFPLGGYQYPQLQTLSSLDPDAMWVAGYDGCTGYMQSLDNEFLTDPGVWEIYNGTLAFYQGLWQTVFSGGGFPLEVTNFYNAYQLYDYARYQYNHDADLSKVISATDLATLQTLAATFAKEQNGQGPSVRAVAGQTLAAKVVAQLADSISQDGDQDKLTLMFGSYQTFFSFFTLAGLANGTSQADFAQLPGNGAAMVFELVSLGGNTSVYPSVDELYVRFLYRNSSAADAPLVVYPLFGDGPSQSIMTYNDFVTSMGGIGITTYQDWCDACNAYSLFCYAFTGDSSTSGGSGDASSSGSSSSSPSECDGRTMSPAAAGAVGAAVTLGAIGLAALAAFLLGGLRLYRADPRRSSGVLGGGFRRAEKMASDPDLTQAKSGARHERMGSWELRGGGAGPQKGRDDGEAGGDDPAGAIVTTTQGPGDGAGQKADDDDAVSAIFHVPVKPSESF